MTVMSWVIGLRQLKVSEVDSPSLANSEDLGDPMNLVC